MRYFSYFFIIILSLPIHEFAHAYVAKILGDDSAQKKGRLTINPMCHVDVIGFLCLFVYGYGWAKPVPVNVSKFSNPKRDMAFVGLAGPVANLVLALAGMFLFKLAFLLPFFNFKSEFLVKVLIIIRYFIGVNVGLAVFNLVPIPPLDGSRIFMCFLPNKFYYSILFLERFGVFFIIFLAWSQNFQRFISYCSFQILSFFDLLTSNFGLLGDILIRMI